MAIITHEIFDNAYNVLVNSLKDKLSDYTLPITRVGSTYDFLAFMEIISRQSEEFVRELIKALIEKMDLDFRNSPLRKERYYVKQTRQRSILTMYGLITFKRTEYIDRITNDSFIYIDNKLHIESRIRYAPDIRAKIYSNYGDCKSMTEVGRNIGDSIEAKYHNGDPCTYAIPRQTVQRILKSVKEVRILSETKKDVDILNILLDEKWIAGQHNIDKDGNNKSLMTKAALIYEDYIKADKSNTKRNKLENCTYYSSYQKDFADELIELIDHKYNLESLKQINFMGDGANWISEVGRQLKFPDVKLKVGLCPFHTGQALDRITRDEEIYDKAYDYLIHKDIKNFNELMQTLIDNNQTKKESIEKNRDYLIKHIDEIITMKKLKVPCAMEQVVSHHLASQFTCVAKAYSPLNLNYYTAIRDAYRNGYNMKLIYAKANDLKKKDEDVIKINKEELDLSFFDKQSPLPYYQLRVNEGTQKFRYFKKC